ncbi:enhancer of polycomb-like-domain-containing protein [Mycena crocata]|nr:enhancer of polycomb-like-domain-containing protein [Mycena crocata]
MAPRVVPPPKKNRARCGIKYPLKIIKGDLGPESEYVDEDLDESQAVMAVADVDREEGNEHHLQAALATKAVFIPTPGTVRVVDNYEQLYPPDRWKDPISYLHTTQTVEEGCSNAFADPEYTYFMDETDKQWLDKNNQTARGEGTSAQGAASGARRASKGNDKEPEMGVPVSITEDEFELVMAMFEKITQKETLTEDRPDFASYRQFFLEPLPAATFASYVTPSWIPAPALLVRIARTIYPHWKHRRDLLDGHKIRPSLNYDEYDFLNESYVCFRRRDNKPVRKTRAGQVVNHADKLAQLHGNLSQALNIANALLTRETVKKAAAVQSQNVWNARLPLVDLLRTFPLLAAKNDEALLVEKPKKMKPPRSSLPKVKVLPPSHPGDTSASSAGRALLPSERIAAIQRDVADLIARDVERRNTVDGHRYEDLEDAYQPPLTPRAEKLWVDVLGSEAQSTRNGARALRVRYGRGGRRFVDRRSSSHPFPSSLRKHRQHVDDDDDDDEADLDETTKRLESQWRFDEDDRAIFGGPQAQDRELVDEYDTRFLAGRLAWATPKEALLVTDASLPLTDPDGRQRKYLPFITNAIHTATIIGKQTAVEYIAEAGMTSSLRPSSIPTTPRATPVSKPTYVPTAAPSHPRAPPPTNMRLPGPSGVPRMQENISPVSTAPNTQTLPAAPTTHTTHTPARLPIPRIHPAQPHNPNPIVPTPAADAVKVGTVSPQSHSVSMNGNSSQNQNGNLTPGTGQNHTHPHPQAHPLQTNGARTAVPSYVPLSAGTNMSLKLPSRVPRPSPLATHSVVASPSRASE